MTTQDTFSLTSPFEPAGHQPQAIDKLMQGLSDGLAYQKLLGVTGSGKTFVMANVIAESQRPAMIMAPNKTLAAQLYSEMKAFFPSNAVEYFVSYYDYYQPEAYVPASDTYIEKDASINEQIEQMRLSATKAILERKDTIIVATVSAIYGLGDPKAYLSMVLHISVGESVGQRTLIHHLVKMQYTRNEIAIERSTYRVRGDVIEIFPAESESLAIRVELFDDEIEAISEFDPLTGRVSKKLPRVTIYPKSHYVTPREQILQTVEMIKVDLKERLDFLRDNQRLVEAQRLEQRTRYDMEMMLELGYCQGIENYSRYLSGRGVGQAPPTLLDYCPPETLLMLDESHVTVPQLRGMYRGDRARKENLVEYGFRLPSAMDNRPLRFDEFERYGLQTIYISATPGSHEDEVSGQTVELVVRPTGLIDPQVEVRPVSSQVDDLLSEITKRVDLNERVLVTTLTKKMAENLCEYYHENGVKVRYLHSDIDTVERVEILRDLRTGAFDVLIGVNLLREGLDLPEVSLVAILDADKEGFLRGENALIQTIGRAARHVRGMAILYADKVTRSMEAAMTETERRRTIQRAFNEEHGITPKTVQKSIRQILSVSEVTPESDASAGTLEDGVTQGVDSDANPVAIAKEIKRLQKEMRAYGDQLEFEQAAACRDQIQKLRASLLYRGAGE